MADFARGVPGSYWYIWGEPNRDPRFTPQAYVEELDYYVSAIKAADPHARIVGPSILNWNFTCRGCGGFTRGSDWMKAFFGAYEAVHGPGVRPPIDVYAIDLYPLTWDAVPMTEWQILVEDLKAYRAWLNSQGLGDKPIWITEVASHWAYNSWTIKDGTLTIGPGLDWTADYRWDAMEGYMKNLLGWLVANGPSYKIEMWFLFISYINIRDNGDYAGIYLFESGEPGAPLNRLGKLYRDMASGIR